MVHEGENCAAFIGKADCSVSHDSDSGGEIDRGDPVGRARSTMMFGRLVRARMYSRSPPCGEIDCQGRWQRETFWSVQAGASGPPGRAPAGGDAARTLHQTLNVLQANARFAYNPARKIVWNPSRYIFSDSAKGLVWLRQAGNVGSVSCLSGEPRLV
jgi:hypothetical protein